MIPAAQVREATTQVLDRAAYEGLQPGPGQRVLDTVRRWVAQVVAELLGSAGAGALAQLLVVVVLAVAVAVGVLVLRRVARRGATPALDDDLATTDVPTLVARAAAAAAAGDHEAAVRARYAALVLALEQRGVLAARPGTTVGEVDAAVRVGHPAALGLVAPAGRALADVVYGARAATPQDDADVARALAAVTPARTVGA